MWVPLPQLYVTVLINSESATAATLESAAPAVCINTADVTSIEVEGGCLRAPDMTSLSTRFPARQIFVVRPSVLMERNEIAVNAFRRAASLSSVEFYIKVSIGVSIFERVNLGVHGYVHSCSFSQCQGFLWHSSDFPSAMSSPYWRCDFSGMPGRVRDVSLKSVSLGSLLEVNQASANLFSGCAALSRIFLLSSPSGIFHSNTLADCPNVSLMLPSAQVYVS
jgi:hypothetical protein